MTLSAQQTWLKVGAALVMGFGALIALAALPALAGIVRFLTDGIFWPFDGAQTLAAPETRLMSAIGGGVMVGWGLALWHLAGDGMARMPDLARKIILGSVVAWFLVDSTASVLAGASLNAVLNLGFLAIFTIPLLRAPAAAEA